MNIRSVTVRPYAGIPVPGIVPVAGIPGIVPFRLIIIVIIDDGSSAVLFVLGVLAKILVLLQSGSGGIPLRFGFVFVFLRVLRFNLFRGNFLRVRRYTLDIDDAFPLHRSRSPSGRGIDHRVTPGGQDGERCRHQRQQIVLFFHHGRALLVTWTRSVFFPRISGFLSCESKLYFFTGKSSLLILPEIFWMKLGRERHKGAKAQRHKGTKGKDESPKSAKNLLAG
jgi:hypothetical protein